MSLFRAGWFKAAWFAAGWFGARNEVPQTDQAGGGFFVVRRPHKRSLDGNVAGPTDPAQVLRNVASSKQRPRSNLVPVGALGGPLAPSKVARIDLSGFVFAQDGRASDEELELIAAALAVAL
jgi:hypothetical protein